MNGPASTAERSVGAQSWKVVAAQCHGADARCLTLTAAVHGSAFHQRYWNRSESFMIFINYYLFCLVFYAPCCLPRRKGCDLICFCHSFGKEDLPWPCQHLSYFAGLFLFHQTYLLFVLQVYSAFITHLSCLFYMFCSYLANFTICMFSCA